MTHLRLPLTICPRHWRDTQALSAVAFGGCAFPSPSGAAHGLTIVGASDGRLFLFDAPRQLSALAVVSAHEGAVTALCLAPDALVSGGSEGAVQLWRPRSMPPYLVRDVVASEVYQGQLAIHSALAEAGAGARQQVGRRPVTAVAPARPPTAPVAAATGRKRGASRAIRAIALADGGREAGAGGGYQATADGAGGLPNLLVGTARCSIWQLGTQRGGRGGGELMGGHFDEASGVAAHPTDPALWVSCGEDRQLLLWHAARAAPVARTLLAAGASSVAFSRDGALIATGHTDGTLSLLCAPTAGTAGAATPLRSVPVPETFAVPGGAGGRVEAVAFAPDCGGHGGMLACGGHDRQITIFWLRPATAPARASGAGLAMETLFVCRGHSATVIHFDWSADSRLLMSNCAAHEILLWAIPPASRVAAAAPRPIRSLKPLQQQAGTRLAESAWASWTCVLGFPVMGCWPDDSDGTDVNSAQISSDGAYLLTADDFGEVKLFRSPCVVEDAPYHAGSGHSSHVSCARFLHSGVAAVSSGSKDRTIIRWDLKKAPEPDPLRPEPIPLPEAPRRGYLLAPQPAPPRRGAKGGY